MSLFGALSSGVSGLTSQSSAMGAISDNITNVSTIGYKNTSVNFQSLVTKQTSSTFYSAGGVQSKPRQDTGVQGLLQASTSATDMAISGNGFFVVNEASEPTVDDQFLYTRSGSFFQDNDGFLRNTSGFYLQGWPTTASGVVKPANSSLTVANQNIVSTDYLSTVNLNRVGGTASSTSTIGIGANLPSNDAAGTEHKTDVQFFDSLGNANTMSVVYTRASAENEWSMKIEPPQGTTHITMEDSITNPKVYRSIGQLEFNTTDSTGASRRPADGASMTIKQGTGATKTYVLDSTTQIAQVSTVTIAGTFDANDSVRATINGTNIDYTNVAGQTPTQAAAGLATAITNDPTIGKLVTASSALGVVTITARAPGAAFTIAATDTIDTGSDLTETVATTTANAGTANAVAQVDTITIAGTVDTGDTFTATFTAPAASTITYTVLTTDTTTAEIAAGMAAAINADTTINPYVSASATGSVVSVTALTAGSTGFTMTAANPVDGGTVDASATRAVSVNPSGTDNKFLVDTSSSTTLAGDVAALLTSIRNNDPNFDTTNNRATTSAGSSTTVLFEDNGLNTITIDPTGLKDSTGAAVTTQTVSFTVDKRDTLYTDATQIKFTAVPADGNTIVINSLTYTFTTDEAEDSAGTDKVIYRDGPLDRVLADLEAAIEANDPDFSGTSVVVRASDSPNNNTLMLSSLTNGNDFTVVTTNLASAPTEPDGSATVGSSIYTATSVITIGTEPAISFSSDGLPNAFNVKELDIRNFANGAANMDDDSSNASQITLDFGTLTEANGMTQFGASFTPVFINQNGSRFGTFAGVTISADGLVTALFDNGETRPIYKLPMATFVNVNGLESRTGNTWNATEQSGDYTLRVADNGPAGQTVQGTLEASTVDIGEEFTDMIVVQRAYSASAKIISTADQMLEELMRVKR